MAKVFIFGMAGVIVIGLIAAAVLLISGSAKLSSLWWRPKRKKIEERSDENDQGPHGPIGGGSGTRWV